MREFTLIILIITFMVYTLNITGFSVKNFVLVESCIKDEPIDLLFWVVYGISLLLFILSPNIGQYTTFAFILLCLGVQYHFTFRFFFRPDLKKIKGYNQFFERTHHIIRPSEQRLIPDTYHIILFLLLMINFVNMSIYLFIY